MNKRIVGVCACPVGVAHTYMAADKFQQVGESLGYEVKVETQGMTGIEDRLSEEDLKGAQWIVLANDVALRDPERFEKYQDKIINTTMAIILHETKSFFDKHIS